MARLGWWLGCCWTNSPTTPVLWIRLIVGIGGGEERGKSMDGPHRGRLVNEAMLGYDVLDGLNE